MNIRPVIQLGSVIVVLFLVLLIYSIKLPGQKDPLADLDVIQSHDYKSPQAESQTIYSKNSVRILPDQLDHVEDIRAKITLVSKSEVKWSTKLDELADLCKALAHTAGMDQGISIVLDEVGPGELRNWMITAVIGASNGSVAAAVERVRKFDNKSESSAGLTGLASMVIRTKLPFEDLSYLKLTPRELKSLALGCAMRIGSRDQAGSQFDLSDAMEMLTSASGNGGISDDVFSEFLDHISRSRPFEALDLGLARLSGTTDSQHSMFEQVVKNSVRAGSSTAMEKLIGSINKINGSTILALTHTGFMEWLAVDTAAARRWFEEKEESLDHKSKSAIESALAISLVRNGDLIDARRLAESIMDVETKSKVTGIIWTAERDSLRKEVGKDPAGTVQSIISGKSKYGDYWIEEAVGTWVAKDFDKAQDWYQQNWNSLPTGKSQYVAAAFATQATRQGDTATARQWAAHIQEPKTKQRIEAGIAKAEGPAGN